MHKKDNPCLVSGNIGKNLGRKWDCFGAYYQTQQEQNIIPQVCFHYWWSFYEGS